MVTAQPVACAKPLLSCPVVNPPRSSFMIRLPKSEFKARALEPMRRVESTGEPLIVTDRGRPTLGLRVVVPATRLRPLERLRGSVPRYDAPFDPVDDEAWENA